MIHTKMKTLKDKVD